MQTSALEMKSQGLHPKNDTKSMNLQTSEIEYKSNRN